MSCRDPSRSCCRRIDPWGRVSTQKPLLRRQTAYKFSYVQLPRLQAPRHRLSCSLNSRKSAEASGCLLHDGGFASGRLGRGGQAVGWMAGIAGWQLRAFLASSPRGCLSALSGAHWLLQRTSPTCHENYWINNAPILPCTFIIFSYQDDRWVRRSEV